MATNQKNIKLEKPADWTVWLLFIRTRAQIDNIWDLVDPDIEERPLYLTRPIEPTYEGPLETTKDFSITDFELYKARAVIYKAQLAKYTIQHEAFKGLITYIQSTISAAAAVFIQEVEAHPWNLLKALKRRLAPSDEYRRLEIEVKYRELCKGPGNQDIDKWLDSWQLTYSEGKELHVAEKQAKLPTQLYLDFGSEKRRLLYMSGRRRRSGKAAAIAAKQKEEMEHYFAWLLDIKKEPRENALDEQK